MSNEANNPYQAPSSDVMDVPRDDINMGGSLEGGIAGQYDFTIKGMLKEAWEKTNGMKGSFWGAALIFIGIMIVISAVLEFIFPTVMIEPGQIPDASFFAQQMTSQLIITVISAPFTLGLLMIGVKRSVERPISFKMIFGYFSLAVAAVIASILVGIFTIVGFMLFILPGLYLSISYMLALPLIGDKKLSAWRAMESSRKAITKRWFKVFGLFIVMFLILLVSLIPLGIGLIWTYPMAVALVGILYREVFGVDSADEAI